MDESSFRTAHKKWLGKASEAAAPLLRIAARGLSRRAPSPPSAWKRALILSHNHLGDVLYRTCSLPVLRSALPGCEWSFLTSPTSAEVIENNPSLDAVLPWNTGDDSWSLSSHAFQKLRDCKFDVALCTNSVRYYPDLLLASALGIPNRVAFTHKGLSGLVTHPVEIDFPGFYPSYFRSMVSAVTGVEGDWPLRPRIFPDNTAEAAAAAVWERIERNALGPVVTCSVTTRQPRGSFPAEVLIDVLAEALKKTDFHVAFCGTAGERNAIEVAASRLGRNATVIAGELTIRGLAAFIRRSSLLLTLDSGPRHLGNAVGVPVFFGRNMGVSKIETGVYCDTETDIAPDGEYLSPSQIIEAGRSVSRPAIADLLLRAISRGARRN